MTTGLIASTEGQELSFDRLVQDVIRQARQHAVFDENAFQRLLANSDRFKDDTVAAIINYSIADDRFGLLALFDFTVPQDYTHDTQLATFALYARKEKFYLCNKLITDENYARATNRLIPGKTYGAKIFSIKERVSSPDCLLFLASQRTILVGAQGISLVRQLKKNQFPTRMPVASFDKKDALWADASGVYGLPLVIQLSDGGWYFDLGDFECEWGDGYCLLSVYELN